MTDDHAAAPPSERPTSFVKTLLKLTPTEFIAFGFYVVPFLVVVMSYDMSRGIGFVERVLPDYTESWKVILWFILLPNAVHFHLSNWDVDEDDVFQDFKSGKLAGLSAPTLSWSSLEWLLRITGLICIYIMPLTLLDRGRGWSIEFVVIGLYFSIFAWDCLVARKLEMEFHQMLHRKYKMPKREDLERDALAFFKYKINIWFLMEGVGLLVSFAYLILSLFSDRDPALFTLILGMVVLLYLLLLLAESVLIDLRRYWFRLLWCGLFMVVLFLIHAGVSSLRTRGVVTSPTAFRQTDTKSTLTSTDKP